MTNFLLTVSYDGTDFHGWQRQKELPTVQKALEEAIRALTGQSVTATASGRTDEGVHALGQAVSFCCDTTVPAQSFPAALNAKLPPSIRAVACRTVPEGFCARRSAKRKTYAYRLYVSPHAVPQMDRYALRVPAPLDTDVLRKACALIVGTHDFAAFYCLGSSAKTTVRTLYDCDATRYAAAGVLPETYEIRFCGDGFLYKMVRLLVGAMLRVCDGTVSLADFRAALGGECDRVRKVPAPAKGLTLVSVEYDA